MSTVVVILDVVKLAAGVALCYFVFFLYQKEFRSGVMEQGFRFIAISTLILTVSRLADLVSQFMPGEAELYSVITTVLGTGFSLVATYGFYLLYRVWHVEKKESSLEKTITQ
jgi:hypothetical protein